MDLKPFVGKKVLLQFKPGAAYAVCTAMEGELSPLMMKGPDDKPQAVIMPHMDGKIEEVEGAPGYPSTYFLIYGDMARKGGRLKVAIDPDLIGFVTVKGEDQAAPAIILP